MLDELTPDSVVLTAGSTPVMRRIADMDWESALGGMAARAYAIAAGISPEEFANRRGASLTPDIVGQQVLQLLTSAELVSGSEFKLSAGGLTPVE